MLSVLIPSYHYNTFPLVKEIQNQCITQGIDFEILCQDDASNSEINLENQKINQFPNCYFFENKVNLGRGRNINSLALRSKHKWLLIMDCDTFPADAFFIKNYVSEIKNNTAKVIFGGIVYSDTKPDKTSLLRWVYGINREAICLKKRIKSPYQTSLSSNLLILKEVFTIINFNENIVKYGYEDVVFMNRLKENSIQIHHIQNTTYHLNLETSDVFLKKIKESLESLSLISDMKLLNDDDSRILKTYKIIKMLYLHHFFCALFTYNEEKLEKNLLSNSPKMLILDLYKLGYFCKLMN